MVSSVKLGSQGEVEFAARAMGFRLENMLSNIDGNGVKPDVDEDSYWSAAALTLSKDGLCVLHTGNAGADGNGHFVAVTRAYINEKGEKMFEIRDSAKSAGQRVKQLTIAQFKDTLKSQLALSMFLPSENNVKYGKQPEKKKPADVAS